MGNFRSVLGDLPGEKMGITYTHEHIFCEPLTGKQDPSLMINDIDASIRELKRFKEAGGCTLVEGTVSNYGRNVEMLKKASQKSGVNLIATAGYFTYAYDPKSLEQKTMEEMADELIQDVTVGIGDTGVRAGQIKAAVSLRHIHPQEEKALRAAARAQKATQAPIWIHHGGIVGMEILDILEDAGADLSKVVLGHMDRNPDPYDYKQIAKRGCYLSMDNITRVTRYPIQCNIDMLNDLLDMGCLERITVSADFGRHTYFEACGGGPGLKYILQKFVPRMKEQCGLDDEGIRTIFVDNPRRIYACFDG